MISSSISFNFDARAALASFFDMAPNTTEGVAPNPKPVHDHVFLGPSLVCKCYPLIMEEMMKTVPFVIVFELPKYPQTWPKGIITGKSLLD